MTIYLDGIATHPLLEERAAGETELGVKFSNFDIVLRFLYLFLFCAALHPS
jgi:hypothetical protein